MTSLFKPALGLVAPIALMFLAAVPVLAQKTDAEKKDDITPVGKWTWERKSGDDMIKCEITVAEKAGKLSGKYKDKEHKLKLQDAKFEDGKFSFAVSPHKEKPDLQIKFEGQLDGDTLKGTMSYPNGDETKSLDWLAKRIEERDAILGKWLLEFETPDGVEIQFKIIVQKKGEGVTVSFADEPSAKVSKAKFKDDLLTFDSKQVYEDQPISVEWELKPTGNQLDGVLYFQFDDADQSGEIEIMGERVK